MKVTPQQAEKLLKGSQTFKQLGLTMMLTRMRKMYINDQSLTTLQPCTDEINAFLDKFKMILSAEDNETLNRL
jgi:hypothetical protein